MLMKIFLPWLVILELEDELAWHRSEQKLLRRIINDLMTRNSQLKAMFPRRGKDGRFIRRAK